MHALRRGAKWVGTVLVALLLLSWVLQPTQEHELARGTSLQVAEGYLTVRMWCGQRAAPGQPADEAPEGGIPDTHNLPLLLVLAVLAAPTTLLWWLDRPRQARKGPPQASAGTTPG